MAWLSAVRVETSQEAAPADAYGDAIKAVFDSMVKPALCAKLRVSCNDIKTWFLVDALGQLMTYVTQQVVSPCEGYRCIFALLPRGPEDENYGAVILREAVVDLDPRWGFEAVDMEEDRVYFEDLYHPALKSGMLSIPLKTAHDRTTFTRSENGHVVSECWDPFYKAFWFVDEESDGLVLWPRTTTERHHLFANVAILPFISSVTVLGRNVLMLTTADNYEKHRNRITGHVLLDPRFHKDLRLVTDNDEANPVNEATSFISRSGVFSLDYDGCEEAEAEWGHKQLLCRFDPPPHVFPSLRLLVAAFVRHGLKKYQHYLDVLPCELQELILR